MPRPLLTRSTWRQPSSLSAWPAYFSGCFSDTGPPAVVSRSSAPASMSVTSAARQPAGERHRLVEERPRPGDHRGAAHRVVGAAARTALGLRDRVGAVERVVERAPARVGRVQRVARVRHRHHELRPADLGDLGVDAGRRHREVRPLRHQIADLGEKGPGGGDVARAPFARVPGVDLRLHPVARREQRPVLAARGRRRWRRSRARTPRQRCRCPAAPRPRRSPPARHRPRAPPVSPAAASAPSTDCPPPPSRCSARRQRVRALAAAGAPAPLPSSASRAGVKGGEAAGASPFTLDAGPTRTPTIGKAPDEAAASSAPRRRSSLSSLATPKPARRSSAARAQRRHTRDAGAPLPAPAKGGSPGTLIRELTRWRISGRISPLNTGFYLPPALSPKHFCRATPRGDRCASPVWSPLS